MSPTTANCPNCAGPIELRNAATVYVVCPHCDGASTRKDVNLDFLGVVAHVADIDSPFDLGARGDMKGLGWTIVGQLQLDHGQGPWNEWCAIFDDGSWRWIAEAQGKVYVTRAIETGGITLPEHSDLNPGDRVDLGEAGDFAVAEVGTGTVVTARGELPVKVRPGARVHYADCSGRDHGFATLDYGSEPSKAERIFVGRRHEFDDLGFHPESVGRREEKRADVERLGCAGCGAPVRRFDDEAVRVVCGHCGSMYDPATQKVLAKKVAPTKQKPLVELGTEIILDARSYRVLAFLGRSVTVDRVRYPWTEYLLRATVGSYRWLVAQTGHWNFVEPIELGETLKKGRTARWRGQAFKHFQGGNAVVEFVLGEVYWAVERGEKVKTDDFVAPPRMLSFESSYGNNRKETVASICTYLPHTDVRRAFKLKSIAKPRGISANQPNPWSVAGLWKVWLGLVAAVILLMVGFHATFAQKPIANIAGRLPSAPTPGPQVWFTDEFEIEPSMGNVMLRLETAGGLDNYWVGFNGALANTITGEVHAFAIAAERWHGVTGGEAWSEGSRKGHVYLGSVPSGTYALRFERIPEAIRADVNWEISAWSQVPSVGRPLLLILLLSLPIVVMLIGRAVFEGQRWQESDHAA